MTLFFNIFLAVGMLANALLNGFNTFNIICVVLAFLLLVINLKAVTSLLKMGQSRIALILYRAVAYAGAAVLVFGLFQLMPQSKPIKDLQRAHAAYGMIGGEKTEEAIDILLSLDENEEFEGNAVFYQNLAVAYMSTGELEKARISLDTAYRLDPSNYSIYFNYGLLQYKKKDYQNALTNFIKAADTNPAMVSAYVNAGAASRILNDVRRSIYYLEIAKRYAPNNLTIRFMLGKTYFDLNEFQKAQEELEWVLSANPPPDMRKDAEVMLKEVVQ